jgi:hypothetical protein
MKAVKRLLPILYLLLPFLAAGQAVPQVQIVQLNMPLFPGDTAYGSQPYTLSFSVQNVSTVPVVTDTLYVFGLNIDTTVAQPLHLLADTIVSNLSQGIIVQVFNPFYLFSSLNYKAGGNIVVVWPRLGNNPSTTFDSITVNIYYVPIQASVVLPAGQPEVKGLIINPSMHTLSFKTTFGFRPERVRIYDAYGRTCFYSGQAPEVIYVPQISKGVYLIEWMNSDGSFSRLKFVWP